MIHTIKKKNVSGFKSPSKVSLVHSKSTDHLTSTHKSIGRKHMLEKSTCNQVSMIKISNSNKTKSAKSLKLKTKSTPKNGQSKNHKKIKNKTKKHSQSDCKTVKKAKNVVKVKLSQQSFNSLQSEKPQPLQYFLYQNTYIPIENSAQRRFVFKIKKIDQRSQQTSDTFFKKSYQSCETKKQQIMSANKQLQKCLNMRDTGAQTQKTMIVQFGTNTTPRTQTQICLQTQSVKFEENVQKCFSHTLTDLQFLFLPDERNFQGFSKPQRVHYRQLFESIANKIWTNGQKLQQLTEQKIQILLYQRQCVQMGMIEFYPEEGFPTHIYALVSYLTNLFSYAQINQKKQALQKIHNIYGYSYQQRFGRLLKGQNTRKKCSPILSEDLFLSLEKQLFKDHDFGSQIVEKSVHVHNKAIFDAVNQQLQKFKPFYFSKGEPFPWSINVGMTFFSIDQSSVGLLFKQIKQKIVMKFGYLCGLFVDYDDFKEIPNKQKHELHIKKLQQQEQKMIQDDIVEANYMPELEQADASLKADLSSWILAQMIQEMCSELFSLRY